jgi:hypothetical protein
VEVSRADPFDLVSSPTTRTATLTFAATTTSTTSATTTTSRRTTRRTSSSRPSRASRGSVSSAV